MVNCCQFYTSYHLHDSLRFDVKQEKMKHRERIVPRQTSLFSAPNQQFHLSCSITSAHHDQKFNKCSEIMSIPCCECFKKKNPQLVSSAPGHGL